MYYVGIYVAKEKYYICILDDTQKLTCKPFWIYLDILGLKNLVTNLSKLSLNNDKFIIGVKSTGALTRKSL